MEDNVGEDFFSQYMPFYSVWYKVLFLFVFQFLIFVLAMVFFWWVSSLFLLGALLGEFIVIFCGILPYYCIVKNIEKIRIKYIEKYEKLAAQQLWYRYESYTIPLLSSSLYFPLLLINYDFIPKIITLPSSIITIELLPWFMAIPLGIFIVVIGILIGKPSGGFGPDVESYFYLLYPEKGKLITAGAYKYVRNPKYLGRFFFAIGLGIIANNILAIGVALMHSLGFISLIMPEDKELLQRFGKEFQEYKKNVPALFPRFVSLKNFVKYIFIGEK